MTSAIPRAGVRISNAKKLILNFGEAVWRMTTAMPRAGVRIPIVTKLILSFVLIIVFISAVFSIAGVRLIGDRIVAAAQEKVRTDLNSAREIYLGKLRDVNDVVRFTALRSRLLNPVLSGDPAPATMELQRVCEQEHLDILAVTDHVGKVLFRTSNPAASGDDLSRDELIRAALERKEPVAATSLATAADLRRESPALAEQAQLSLVVPPNAWPRKETEESPGLLLKAAAPILNSRNNVIGVVYGGVLLNRNFEIVDKIKQTVFQGLKYEGEDIGTATIFQDDLRIATNVRNADGTRAIGTRVAEDVYDCVVREGRPWIGRAYVVNNWYITAYEPIRDLRENIVGMLYVGILEQKYADMRQRAELVFLAIALGGALVSLGLAWYISGRISNSIKRLANAYEQLARGNLDTKVEIRSHDELHELAETFNFMAAALKKRDEKLREFATKRIMESERLAVIGQLAAGVAHEINNPLQGIVTYSHLLLERLPDQNGSRASVEKIVAQTDRCRTIIRGLLDFSRPRKPEKRLSQVNNVLQDCVALVADQALFHNIEIVKKLAGNLPQVLMDPSQIQQVFVNLIINAAEAMNGSGRLTLATRLDPADNAVEIEFTDTGHGICEEDMEKLFNPFFTTKEVGHGTGLGLAISFGIVKEHHGTISVESDAGKGTTFLVRLPVSVEVEV